MEKRRVMASLRVSMTGLGLKLDWTSQGGGGDVMGERERGRVRGCGWETSL
jgi:hypothetical protein